MFNSIFPLYSQWPFAVRLKALSVVTVIQANDHPAVETWCAGVRQLFIQSFINTVLVPEHHRHQRKCQQAHKMTCLLDALKLFWYSCPFEYQKHQFDLQIHFLAKNLSHHPTLSHTLIFH